MIKVLLIIFLILPLGFLVWMNVTPGHFQADGCYCRVRYFDKNPEIRICPAVLCKIGVLDGLILSLAKMDFYK